MATQSMFEARLIPAAGGSPISIKIPANDNTQAKVIIQTPMPKNHKDD